MSPTSAALRRLACCLLLLAAGVSPLPAHDFWIAPSSFRPAPGAAVSVALRVGAGFRGEPVPWVPFLVERFALLGPSGELPLASTRLTDPAALARLVGPGVYWLLYESRASRLEQPAERFEAYLREEGLEGISALRRRRGESAQSGREAFFRSAKALLCVGSTPGGAAGARLGLALELIAESDPCALRAGDRLAVRLEHHGRPVPDALVAAIPDERPDGRLEARTDGAGRVAFALPRTGRWLLKTVHMLPAGPGGGVDWESHWAALTLEVAAP